ncbi:MAG: ABC transporter ATP-binding protein [Alphaproteobacteria bacterium]|nr:ABC transporter ATP-binding protein [Alphaproteobacteria bacterium]
MPQTAPPAAPAYAVEAIGLTKEYRSGAGRGPVLALDHVDLAIPRGSFFGLLGPNGAGKSTFINILAALVIKSAGVARIWGADVDDEPRTARSAIGVVPQELSIDPFFTPREMLELYAGFYGVPQAARRTDAILAAVGLESVAGAPARSLSGGMRRRLLVAKAMVHDPPVLVLDEPTAGVDIELRRQLWDHLRHLNARGTTIVLTTHYLEEAEQLCDRIAIIHRGRVVALDTTANLVRRFDRKELSVSVAQEVTAVPVALRAFDAEVRPYRELHIRYRPSQTPIAAILAAVQEAGLTILDLSTEESDLEEVFLALTSETARGTDEAARLMIGP